jgi:membrane associated rhomboid family serine protease
MLEDRYYMRQSSFESRKSATVILVIVLVAVFFVQLVLARFTELPVDPYMMLSLWGVKHGFVWQFFSYQLMHAGFLHLLVNCWAIYVFGRDVEEALGLKKFLALYLGSGVLGGLLQILLAFIFGSEFGSAVVGASAAAFGLAAAFAVLFPDRILLLFFIIPIRAKYLLWISAVLAVFGLLSTGTGIAHGAHLGGMLTGLFFIKYALDWNWDLLRLPRFRPRGSRQVKVVSNNSAWRAKPAKSEDLPPAEFLSKEVDPILDKISAHGIQSLTERERRILEAAREKMAKR